MVEAVFELITPLVVAYVIDTAIPEGAADNYRPLIAGAAIIVALGVVGLGFSLTAQFFASRASLGFGTNLRRDLYAHVLSLSPAEFDKISAPSLITRLTADVNQAQQAVAMFIRLVTRAPFIVIGATVMSIIIDLKLSLIFIGAAIVIGLVLFIILTTTMPKYKRVQEKLDKTMLLTREQLAGARVVRAFNAESREENVCGRGGRSQPFVNTRGCDKRAS
ncbi:MAG: ABC transporter permease [Christensenellales bacterium]